MGPQETCSHVDTIQLASPSHREQGHDKEVPVLESKGKQTEPANTPLDSTLSEGTGTSITDTHTLNLHNNASGTVLVDPKIFSNEQHPPGSSLQVGDNREKDSPIDKQAPAAPSHSNSFLPPSKDNEPWHLVFKEMRAMRTEMKSIAKIEKFVEDHTTQLQGIVHHTSELESVVDSSAARIRELNDEVATLKKTE